MSATNWILLVGLQLLQLISYFSGVNGQSTSTPTLPQATEQFAAGGIAMVIGDEETANVPVQRNKTTEEIQELRNIVTPEAKLYREIMKNYDKLTRPVFNASHVVTINLTFTFSQVLNVEEKEQSMSVILWMDHNWFDEKLIWNPKDYDGIEEVKIPSTSLWLPDIVLYNTAEERIIKSVGIQSGSRAYVKYDGSIYWPPIKRYMSSCNIDITYFPFDDQICYLKLGSWAYDGFQVNIWNTMMKMEMGQAKQNSEFAVVDSKIRRYITYYRCCIEPYPDIKVYIHIRRQTIQHVFNIIIPCVTLSIICMVGFLIPPDKNDEKISVQLTVLFSLSLFMLLVAESTPRTSENVPLISIYLTALMCITAMSTTAHVVCDKLVSSPSIRKEVPYLANKLIYKLVLCCNKQKKQLKKTKTETGSLVANNETSDHDSLTTETESLSESTTGTRPKHGADASAANTSDNRSSRQQSRGSKRGQSLSVIHENTINRRHEEGMTATDPLNDNTEEGLQGLFHHLKLRQDKMRSDLQDTAKWYKVATKMDRIFFWSYGSSVTILTLYAFVFKPMQKDVDLYKE